MVAAVLPRATVSPGSGTGRRGAGECWRRRAGPWPSRAAPPHVVRSASGGQA